MTWHVTGSGEKGAMKQQFADSLDEQAKNCGEEEAKDIASAKDRLMSAIDGTDGTHVKATASGYRSATSTRIVVEVERAQPKR